MKEVIAALRAQRKTHTAALARIDAMLKRAGVSEGKAKRRRTRVAKGIKPPTTTPAAAKATATPARPAAKRGDVKALRSALKANAKKDSTPTPANGRGKNTNQTSDLFD